MKKSAIVLLVFMMAASMLFSGCAVITNIFDPLPDEYMDGVKYSRDYPDDDLEIYDDAIVFEADEDEDKGEIMIKYGSADDLGDLIDFYEDMFDDNDTLIVDEDKTDEGKNDYHAEGRGDGFKFEVDIEEASGEYEMRVFATVVEVNITAYEMGEETLANMQGFWFATGFNGEISEDYKKEGYAMEIDGMTMDSYDGFVLDTTGNKFEFVDDDTISHSEDGEVQTLDISFETIDGVEYMVLTSEGLDIYLEKSSYDAMMLFKEEMVPGAETLEQLMGFWLVCGQDGDISSDYYSYGMAIDFMDMVMDFYYDFEIDSSGVTFEFIDDDTIHYWEDGDEYTVDIAFDSIGGAYYLILTNEGTSLYFEQSSYEEMLLYNTSYGGGSVIYLSDYLTDEELTYYITDLNWYLTYYYYTDGTYDYADDYNRIYLDSYYYSGEDEFTDESYDMYWYIYDSIIYFVYDDGATYSYLVDYEYDGYYSYMYLFNAEEGYSSTGWVYTVY